MRRSFALVAALTAGLLGSGCGSGGADPVQVVRAAATRTAAAESARMSFSISMTGGQANGTVKGDGVFAFARHRGRLTMDVGGIAGSPVRGAIDVVLDGTTMYLRLPGGLGAFLPAGKSWVSLDLQKAGEIAGVDLGQLGQTQQADPSQALDYLRGASDSVEKVGDEQVRGTATTHYKAQLDLRKAMRAKDGPSAQIEKVIQLLGTSTLPADVWIDHDGTLRKMAWTQPMPGSSGGTLRYEMELFDFGAAVDVTPPPPAETVDLTTLLGRKPAG